MTARPRRATIAVAFREPEWRRAVPGAAALVRRAAGAALEDAARDLRDAEVSVVLADDALLGQLNAAHRGIDKPTDVLSFPAFDLAPGALPPVDAPRPLLMGDVVVGLETAARDAAFQGKPLADHLCHLVVHGVLHLLGHDHERAAEAAAMEAREAAILARLGIADPYGAHPVTAAR